MKFTIIIPTYNAGQFVDFALKSLIKQDLDPSQYEVIVADDASTDDTIGVVDAFIGRFSNLRLISLKENKGPGVARNAALNAAVGDWVIFLDSDDTLTSDCLSYLDREIARNVGVEVVAFNWKYLDRDHQLPISTREGRRDTEFLNPKPLRVQEYLCHRMDGSVIYTATSRNFLNKHGIRFTEGYHEDVDVIFKIYIHSNHLISTNKVLYVKTPRCGSIISSISERHISGYFNAWNRIGTEIKKINGDWAEQCLNNYRYGTIGAVATRIREVYRHSTSIMLTASLYLQIRLIISPAELETLLSCFDGNKTVYFKIVTTFNRLMMNENLNDIEKAHAMNSSLREMEGNSWSCTDLHHSIFMRPDEIRTCCKRFFVDGEMKGDVVLFPVVKGDGPREIVEKTLYAKQQLHQKINSGLPNACDGCPFLEFKKWPSLNVVDLRYISFEYHSMCNLECSYCSPEYFDGRVPNYDIVGLTKALIESEALANCETAVWGGGEPTIGKEFKIIFNLLSEKLPAVRQRVLTNSVKFNPALSEALAAGRTQVITSIDAGTPDVFTIIRGKNRLMKVIDNLRSYSAQDPAKVTIKYIFTDGNADLDQVHNFVRLMQKYELLKCNFQISSDFKSPVISPSLLLNMIIMFGLLRKHGASCVYFDELLRHRLQAELKCEDENFLATIESEVGEAVIADPRDYKEVIIWGAGQQAAYLLQDSNFLKNVDVICFVDATEAKIGTKFHGYEVKPPSYLNTCEYPVIIAAVQGYPLILESYLGLGLPHERLVAKLIV
jgi:glycosyltransferase involved in cell wall biosynthesis